MYGENGLVFHMQIIVNICVALLVCDLEATCPETLSQFDHVACAVLSPVFGLRDPSPEYQRTRKRCQHETARIDDFLRSFME